MKNPEIGKFYTAGKKEKLSRTFDTNEAQESSVRQDDKNQLPFPPLTEEEMEYNNLSNMLVKSVENGVKYTIDGKFKNERDKERAEQAAIQHSIELTPDFLRVWQLLGEDNNVAAVETLEKKYHCELENLRVAALLFGLTYEFWSLTNKDTKEPTHREFIESRLPIIIDKAKALSAHKVHATHQLMAGKFYDPILYSQTLKPSGTEHYEGAGVYLGILGGYQDWGFKEKTFSIKISLADTFPIITGKIYPQAMANVLCEELDIHKGTEECATPEGVIEWNNDEYYDEEIDEWKKETLKKIFHCEPIILKEKHGDLFVVLDTDEKPIVWASVAKALKIRRLMPNTSYKIVKER